MAQTRRAATREKDATHTVRPSRVSKVIRRSGVHLGEASAICDHPADARQHGQGPGEEADLGTALLGHVGRVEDEEAECQGGANSVSLLSRALGYWVGRA
jgi:hypothetical protein